MKAPFKRAAAFSLSAIMLLSLAGCCSCRSSMPGENSERDASASFTPEHSPVSFATAAPTEVLSPVPTAEASASPAWETEPAPIVTETPEPAGAQNSPAAGKPTAAPTLVPAAPTAAAPTEIPTAVPTASPSPVPTVIQTEAPEPAFVFETYDIVSGKKYTESVFAEKELTMLFFWATWCEPVLGKLSDIESLSREYPRLNVITVLYDSGNPGAEAAALEIVNDLDLTVPVLRRNSSVMAAFDDPYFVQQLMPQAFFIGADGRLLSLERGVRSFDEWCGIIDGLL